MTELVELGKIEKIKKEDVEKEVRELEKIRDTVKSIIDKIGPKIPLGIRKKFEELEKEYKKIYAISLNAAPIAIAAGAAAIATTIGVTYHIIKIRKLKNEYLNLYNIIRKYIDYLPEQAKKEIILQTSNQNLIAKDTSQIITIFITFLLGFLALQFIKELKK
ncbi:MAG: hypothetical protein QXJ14_02805 [Candidatus Aenigmatarchaeota archaeon]